MTLFDLLALANAEARRHFPGTPSYALASAVLDLLAESAPCGYEQPEVIAVRGHGSEDMVRVPESWAADVFADDARAMALMLLRAADQAEKAREPIENLIKRSSIGKALDDIKMRGIDAHLADELKRRRRP